MSEKKIEIATAYRWFCDLDTRWMDNDVYGHVNNVVYYSYFDTAANRYLIERGGLDIAKSEIIGVVVESQCVYYAPIAYPEKIRAGVRVDKVGNRSVTYGIAIFREGSDDAVASGYFVHVFVDRTTRKPVAIPERIRSALEAIAT